MDFAALFVDIAPNERIITIMTTTMRRELSRTQTLPEIEEEQVAAETETYSPPNRVGYSTMRRTAEMAVVED